MISELKIRNFKSLESVDLKLGHFNLLVGANASGKSNFLDALRFLQGVGSGLSLDETLNGTPSASTNIRWAGIRGGSSFVAFRSSDGTPAEVIELHTSFNEGTNLESPAGGFTYNLTCSVNRTPPLITHETVDSAGVPLISDELRFSILPITFHPVTDSDPMLKGSDEGEIIPDQTRSMLATLSS